MNNEYVIVTWPYSQHLMECAGFYSNSSLINTEEGLNEYGSSAFVVDADWYKSCQNDTLEEDGYRDDPNDEIYELDDNFDLSALPIVYPEIIPSTQK